MRGSPPGARSSSRAVTEARPGSTTPSGLARTQRCPSARASTAPRWSDCASAAANRTGRYRPPETQQSPRRAAAFTESSAELFDPVTSSRLSDLISTRSERSCGKAQKPPWWTGPALRPLTHPSLSGIAPSNRKETRCPSPARATMNRRRWLPTSLVVRLRPRQSGRTRGSPAADIVSCGPHRHHEAGACRCPSRACFTRVNGGPRQESRGVDEIRQQRRPRRGAGLARERRDGSPIGRRRQRASAGQLRTLAGQRLEPRRPLASTGPRPLASTQRPGESTLAPRRDVAPPALPRAGDTRDRRGVHERSRRPPTAR